MRPIHRADIHIIEPQGSELWLDVKIHTVNPDLVVAKELLREELTKCRAYGQRDGFNLQALNRGMIPVVLEQFGRTAPGAQAILTASSITGYRSLSDKQSPSLSRRGPLAPNHGAPFLAPCSEQHGKPTQNVHPESARSTWVTHPAACQTAPGSLSEQHERMSSW